MRRTSVATGAVATGMVAMVSCTISPRYRPYYYPQTSVGISAGVSTSTNVAYGASTASTASANVGVGSANGGALAMVQAADRILRAQNYQPVGNVVQQVIPARGLVSFPVMTQPGQCYTVFAVGDVGVNDVDLEVVSPSGQTVGEDRATDAHPNVSFCASEYGTHFARVHMFSGAGNVFFAVYQGPAGTSGNVAAAFTGSTTTATTASAPGQPDPNTMARIQAVRARLQAQGYQQVRDLSGVVMTQGQTQNWPTLLPGGWCYAFATFGGPGVQDSDVFLFDASGARQIAGDAGTAVDAVIEDICTTTAASYQLRPRLYSGNGTVWLLAMARPNPATNAVASTQPSQSSVLINTQATGGGGSLDDSYRRLERTLVSLGYATVGTPVDGSLQTGANASHQVTLQQGNCYAIAATGDSSVGDIDLYLLDGSGREIDRDYAMDARPVVRVCPRTTGTYTVQVNMAAGSGGYRMGLFQWEGGTRGAGMSGLLFVRNAEVTRLLQADGYQGDASFELFRGRVREGASTTRTVNLQNGTCYAFVAVGGEGVSDLNMTVQHGNQTVAEDRSLTAFPAVRYCARSSGQHRVVIESRHGTGEFVFRVFRRGA